MRGFIESVVEPCEGIGVVGSPELVLSELREFAKIAPPSRQQHIAAPTIERAVAERCGMEQAQTQFVVAVGCRPDRMSVDDRAHAISIVHWKSAEVDIEAGDDARVEQTYGT